MNIPTSNLPSRPAITHAVHTAINQQRLVGAVVLVAHRGELVHVQASGLADREQQRAIDVDTLFRLASVSKPIVSTAALVLIAQGKLALDEDIRRWLPDFTPRYDSKTDAVITVRQLLNHTAGLSYGFYETDSHCPLAKAGVSDGMDSSPVTLAENMRRLASVPLLFPPGSAWCYSLSVDVLGAVIEQVFGAPLQVAVRELVTGPLGMHDTGFSVDRSQAQRLATPYVNDHPQPHILQEDEKVSDDETTVGVTFSPERIFNAAAFPSAGAGMAGSAPDLLRLLEALRANQGAILPPELIAEMGRDQIPGFEMPDAPGQGFGLGFSVLRDPQAAGSPASPGTWRWGGVYGNSWFVDPVREISVVAMTNTLYEGVGGAFVEELRNAVYASLKDA
ncbi:serine hydrolase domain-containing protein [Pantoea sp. A4]|uniref:serine hydrolase domain-containing protein n=1 Tax=Pantoea sp. A4 TaxID=1225184 RepID=UPI0003625547|nr:serine hydrolase domain-containing protein [Pantoea sp. A4]